MACCRFETGRGSRPALELGHCVASVRRQWTHQLAWHGEKRRGDALLLLICFAPPLLSRSWPRRCHRCCRAFTAAEHRHHCTAAQFLVHTTLPPPMLHPQPVSTSVGAKVKALGHFRRRAPCQSAAELQAHRGRPEPEPLCSLSRASCIPHKP